MGHVLGSRLRTPYARSIGGDRDRDVDGRCQRSRSTGCRDRHQLTSSVEEPRRSPDAGANFNVDKVVLLKRVTIFEAIPHEVLASVASLLTERWFAAGERIFDKGDLGDSLYVIGNGRVRVHDGELTLREMSKDEFFGELSLLRFRATICQRNGRGSDAPLPPCSK